jgi:hypothetical protein
MSLAEYKMVVFGDSIAWGQGLAEEEKYSTNPRTKIVVTVISGNEGA